MSLPYNNGLPENNDYGADGDDDADDDMIIINYTTSGNNILSASIRECHDDAVMSASHSFSCYTDFTLKDELRHSGVMKLLLRGKNYSENMSTQNNLSSGVEPPLDLSYSTGLAANANTCKRRPCESALQVSAKRRCVRCDFVAQDANTSYLHYQLHRKLQSGIDWRRGCLDQQQIPERDGSGSSNPDDSSTLRTLLRRYDKLPALSCGSPSCFPLTASTATRPGYSSESDSRSVESTPSASPYQSYMSRISSPSDGVLVTEMLPPSTGLVVPEPGPPGCSSEVHASCNKMVVKCEEEEQYGTPYYNDSAVLPKRPKIEMIQSVASGEKTSDVPISSASGTPIQKGHLTRLAAGAFVSTTDNNRSAGPHATLPGALSCDWRCGGLPAGRKDAGVQCELTSENSAPPVATHPVAPESSCRCHCCGITFDDDVMYSIHMGCHNHRDPFICNVCGKSSDNKYTFYTHIMRGHEYT
ncbi:hypothetical protein LSH36_415g02034 [Paralvinella palmiformis]|uniref:C2H2-type domain-containing protein n=1 Tax=Paralvinella palmiformis TaxID=53620 RepID=A0AAD9MZU8_9ANNE|nr:hypothetical protein LSH36_415g02034 [Paralvinella palmiformis]